MHESQPQNVAAPHKLNHSKSTTALPKQSSVRLPSEKIEDFREVRSRLRPTSSSPTKAHQSKTEDLNEGKQGLSHYSPPPKETSAKNASGKVEEKLRKIRSGSVLATPERDETEPMDMGKGRGKEKEASIKPPKSRSPARSNTKDKEKARGRPLNPEPHVIENGRAVSDKPLKPEGPHGIDDCRTVDEKPPDHQCEWKEKYANLKSDVDAQGQAADDIGLEGLTIVLHMKGRDDLVINTDLRNLE